MRRATTGQYVSSVVGGEEVRAFVPSDLPPTPAIQPDEHLAHQIETATVALGRLDGVAVALPNTRLFLYSYVRKEAVLSSQIEGTQSSLSDLLLFELDEAPGAPFDDVVEVSNYVAAMEHGLQRIREGMPLSNRLLREMHERLMAGARGGSRSPGEFRRSQNWIGGTRPGNAAFVPPPHTQVEPCMGALEKFLHNDPVRTPPLLKSALAHVQFETIHPFLDGNGRLGRLLVTMLLCVEGVLHEPLLYLSLYLKQNRTRYYELLDRVRRDGEWEEWIAFFARGVEVTANDAFAVAQRLREIATTDRARIQGIGRLAGSALRVHDELQMRPIATIGRVAKAVGLSVPAVTDSFAALGELGLVREVTGKKRNRIFAYAEYLEALQRED